MFRHMAGNMLRIQEKMLESWESLSSSAPDPLKPLFKVSAAAGRSIVEAQRRMVEGSAPSRPQPSPAPKPASSGAPGPATAAKPAAAAEPAAPAKEAPKAAVKPVVPEKPREQAVAGAKPGTEQPAAEPKPATAPIGEDDLTVIKGVGPALAAKLNAYGITSLAQIAAWTEQDIENIERDVLPRTYKGRIERDDWRGQAKAARSS